MMHTRFVVVLCAVALACSSSTGPGPGTTIRRAATLEHFGDPARLEAPETAQAGAPVVIDFTTFGGGCVGDTENELSQNGLEADVRSFQREYIPRANEACTDELRITRNAVTFTFSSPGTARIRVFGRKMPGATPLVLERTVSITQ